MGTTYTDHTRPWDAEAHPRVDVVVVNTRGTDHPWTAQAIESVKRQRYEALGLIEVDNTDRALSLGQAWNEAVKASTAPLMLFLREEDFLVEDVVESLVTFYLMGKRDVPSLAHVTTLITLLDERTGFKGTVTLPHAGMFERERLVAHPFDETLSKNVAAEALDRIGRAMPNGEPMTMGVHHHHGYVWRDHPFRVDALNLVK